MLPALAASAALCEETPAAEARLAADEHSAKSFLAGPVKPSCACLLHFFDGVVVALAATSAATAAVSASVAALWRPAPSARAADCAARAARTAAAPARAAVASTVSRRSAAAAAFSAASFAIWAADSAATALVLAAARLSEAFLADCAASMTHFDTSADDDAAALPADSAWLAT